MKRVLVIALCAVLIFGLSSCGKNDKESNLDDSYLEGLDRGQKDTFLSLFNASSPQKFLSYADVWETEAFSLSFTDSKVENTYSYAYDEYDHLLKCNLALKDFTIDEGQEEKNIYLGMYSRTSDGTWCEVVSDYEYYYLSAIVEDNYTWGSYTAEATFELYDNPRYVVTIIVVDGTLYNAVYMVNEKE